MAHCAKCGKPNRAERRRCIHCGAAVDRNANSVDELTIITTLLEAGSNTAPGYLGAIPSERLERLSFTMFQVALTITAEAVARRVEARAAATAKPTRKSQSIVRNEGSEGVDRVVQIAEAARLLGYSKKRLYHHHKELPFTRITPSGRLRFSFKGILEYMDSLKIIKDDRR
jgi:hypothetical protein